MRGSRSPATGLPAGRPAQRGRQRLTVRAGGVGLVVSDDRDAGSRRIGLGRRRGPAWPGDLVLVFRAFSSGPHLVGVRDEQPLRHGNRSDRGEHHDANRYRKGATAINNNGQIVANATDTATGQNHALLLTPS